MERTGWGRRTSQVGGTGRKQILMAFGIQAFLRGQGRHDLTQLSLQLGLILESRIKRRATCRWTRNKGKGCSWPLFWSDGFSAGNFKPTPHQGLTTDCISHLHPRDHLRFLNLFEHLFGHLFWNSVLLNDVLVIDGSISSTWPADCSEASCLSSVSWVCWGGVFFFFSFF